MLIRLLYAYRMTKYVGKFHFEMPSKCLENCKKSQGDTSCFTLYIISSKACITISTKCLHKVPVISSYFNVSAPRKAIFIKEQAQLPSLLDTCGMVLYQLLVQWQ